MGDDIAELSTGNDIYRKRKNKICFYDEKWLEKSKLKLSKQVDGEKKSKFNKV